MELEEWGLVVCVVLAGLFSGLLAMLTLILQPMMARMSGPELARFLRVFLPPARTSPFNQIEVLGLMIAPVVVLFALGETDAPFWLTATGLALTTGGLFLVSRRLSEPNYDVMLAWDPDSMPANWEATRRRYFTLNWIRAAATWTAFGLFLAALVDLLRS